VSERVLTGPLRLFLCLCGLAVAASLIAHAWPESAAAALTRLRDGDLERAERVQLLARVAAAAGTDGVPSLAAAGAAIALGDADGYARVCAGRPLPFATAPDAATLSAAAVGDRAVETLLVAMAAEAAGERARARAGYERAAASARLYAMPFAQRLAVDGGARVRD